MNLWKGKGIRLILAALFISVILFGNFENQVFGWPWSRDMYKNPHAKAGVVNIKEPMGSIPRDGVNPVSLGKMKLKNPVLVKNAYQNLRNPVRPDEESLRNGERLFRVYCVPCHGPKGKGGGEVSKRMVPAQDITSDIYKAKPDGFFFATIVAGGVIMPAQKKGLSEKDIWDIVNFIRKLQGFDVMEKWEKEYGSAAETEEKVEQEEKTNGEEGKNGGQ